MVHRRDPPMREALKRDALGCDNWGRDPPLNRDIQSFAATASIKADEILRALAGVTEQSAPSPYVIGDHCDAPTTSLFILTSFTHPSSSAPITLTSDSAAPVYFPCLELRLSLLLTVRLTMLQARFCRAPSPPMRMDASSTP